MSNEFVVILIIKIAAMIVVPSLMKQLVMKAFVSLKSENSQFKCLSTLRDGNNE